VARTASRAALTLMPVPATTCSSSPTKRETTRSYTMRTLVGPYTEESLVSFLIYSLLTTGFDRLHTRLVGSK
jgi:hypothetical protein